MIINGESQVVDSSYEQSTVTGTEVLPEEHVGEHLRRDHHAPDGGCSDALFRTLDAENLELFLFSHARPPVTY